MSDTRISEDTGAAKAQDNRGRRAPRSGSGEVKGTGAGAGGGGLKN